MQSSRKPSHRKQASLILKARHARVPLDRIRVPPSSLTTWEARKPLPPLLVSEETAEVVLLIRPPLLMADATMKGHYVALANTRILHWYRQQAGGQESASTHKVACLVFSGEPSLLEQLGDIEAHLVPLLLGEASDRVARTARRKLKQAGVERPRKVSARERLKQTLSGR